MPDSLNSSERYNDLFASPSCTPARAGSARRGPHGRTREPNNSPPGLFKSQIFHLQSFNLVSTALPIPHPAVSGSTFLSAPAAAAGDFSRLSS
mmetsp:Transcript_26124/g.85906  ORF Transcript_26124/g.85906 Transcript_26124/m.85906 type:complete len:93 (-) Transcript_26124:2009-2287(-)